MACWKDLASATIIPKSFEATRSAEMACLRVGSCQTIKLRWNCNAVSVETAPVADDCNGLLCVRPTMAEPARSVLYAKLYAATGSPMGRRLIRSARGYFAVMIRSRETYDTLSGDTPLTGKSLFECAEAYFAQSEQLPTRVRVELCKIHNGLVRDETTACWRCYAATYCPKRRPLRAGRRQQVDVLLASDLVDGEEGD